MAVTPIHQWVSKSVYRSCNFVFLNELNRKMQGKNANLLTRMDKIRGFMSNLGLGIQFINELTDIFSTIWPLVVGNKTMTDFIKNI